jgi:hypothetical protein
MNSIVAELAIVIEDVAHKFNIDGKDLIMLGRLQIVWASYHPEDRMFKVMDAIKEFSDIASPANVHKRITKHLVDLKLIKLVADKKDARVKYITEGIKFKKLVKFLEEFK